MSPSPLPLSSRSSGSVDCISFCRLRISEAAGTASDAICQGQEAGGEGADFGGSMAALR